MQERTLARLGVGLAATTVALSLGAPLAVAATIIGTAGDDELTGTAAADEIWGGRGNDVMDGVGGEDILHGGPGTDTLAGGAGRDALRGDSSADVLRGQGGPDKLYTFDDDQAFGGSHTDTIRVGNGDTDAFGEADNDWMIAWGVGSSRLYGGIGSDQMLVESNGAGKELYGGPDGDSLESRADGATMNGGDGEDTLVMRWAGWLAGGDGPDTLIGDSADHPSPTILNCGTGVDRAVADLADSIADDCEDVTVNINGDDANNVIVGTKYADSISAFGGADDIQSLGGDDGITPWEGTDTVDAGPGNDIVFADTGSHFQIPGDVDEVVCGDGTDEVYADDVDTVASDCEIVHVAVAPKG